VLMKQPTNFDYNPQTPTLFKQLQDKLSLLDQPTYWSSETLQKFVKKLVKVSDTWQIDLQYNEKQKVWYFNLPQYLTFNEWLCNGTEVVVSYYYKKLTGKFPDKNSKMSMVVSSKQLQEFTTKVTFLYDDPYNTDSSVYLDSQSYPDLTTDVWLCPYLQLLFGEKPEKLWLKFNPTK
jgi:hypothetical protein